MTSRVSSLSITFLAQSICADVYLLESVIVKVQIFYYIPIKRHKFTQSFTVKHPRVTKRYGNGNLMDCIQSLVTKALSRFMYMQ